MRTIKIEVEDTIYDRIVKSGIDIEEKFEEFIYDFADNGYPGITTKEAEQRVSDAFKRYKSGKFEFDSYDKSFVEKLDSYIDNL